MKNSVVALCIGSKMDAYSVCAIKTKHMVPKLRDVQIYRIVYEELSGCILHRLKDGRIFCMCNKILT